jgi:hypothetical protein
LPALRATLASYSGHLRHGAAYRRWAALWDRHDWLAGLFVREGHDPWLVRARWPERPLRGPRFSAQYWRLIRRAGRTTLVFCQVGRFIEFYGPQREVAAQALRLVRVSIARGGYGFSVGFPVSLQAGYVSRAVRGGYVVAEVHEAGRLAARCAARRVIAIWLPSHTSHGSLAASFAPGGIHVHLPAGPRSSKAGTAGARPPASQRPPF